MDPVTPKGETEEPKPLEKPSTPPVDTAKDSEIERLRKELEQKTMRENQLANQLKAKEEAEAEAKRQQAEANEEFKNLYEQERLKNEERERELEATKRQDALKSAQSEVLADFSDEVKTLAEEAGMSLADDSEEAKQLFKQKLDKIASMVTKSEKVSPNNPAPQNNRSDLTGDDLKLALKSEAGFHEVIMQKFPSIANMTQKK